MLTYALVCSACPRKASLEIPLVILSLNKVVKRGVELMRPFLIKLWHEEEIKTAHIRSAT